MKKRAFGAFAGVLLVALFSIIYFDLFGVFTREEVVFAPESIKDEGVPDVYNATYLIEEEDVSFKEGNFLDGESENPVFQNSYTIVGAPFYQDFDKDGDMDASVWILNDPGGSGKFFYAGFVMNGEEDNPPAMFVGDRILVGDIDYKYDKVLYNFKDRKPGEPFTAEPTLERRAFFSYNEVTRSFDFSNEDILIP